jgi:hypothetical protein
MIERVEATDRRPWLRTAILVGVVYCAVGVIFQGPLAWRLAAWLVSGVAYVLHLAYEHFGLRNPPRQTHASCTSHRMAPGPVLAGWSI